jgi:integrase
MARRIRDQRLETGTARLKLSIDKKPYWLKIDRGTSLGYRRNNGGGTWVLRVSNGKGGHQTEKIGTADDYEDASLGRTLDFWTAYQKARELAPGARNIGNASGKLVTVREALAAYADSLRIRGGDRDNADRIRRHLPPNLGDKTVALLSVQDFTPWHAALAAAELTPASINRTNNGLRAMLNHAADLDDRITNAKVWTKALRTLPNATVARNTVLDEQTVRAVVSAAYADSEQFGLLIEVLAVTGTRISQAARLEVRDVQASRADARLMMPSSKKGGTARKITQRPVPIPAKLAVRLLASANGRPDDAPLLLKPDGSRWGKSNHAEAFARTVKAVAGQEAKQQGIDPGAVKLSGHTPREVTIYSLRHSSITRMLLGNVPIRVVAALHDTSVSMIEKTYAHLIADHSDALARRVLLEIGDNISPTPQSSS